MIFNSSYLREGDVGGKHASTVLHDMVQKWAVQNIIETPADVKVVVRIYANLGGLADVCTKVGLTHVQAIVLLLFRETDSKCRPV